MPLPAVGGTLVKDIDPSTFGLADGTALTFANSGLTPVLASPTYRTNVFDTGQAGIRVTQGVQGFSITRPVQDDFTLYAIVHDMLGQGSGSQFFQNGALIDCEALGVVNDFGISLRADGKLVAGTGNPDTSGIGTAVITVGTHILAITRVKATGAFKVYVDDVLDISLTNNTNTLSAQANLSFGSGTSTGKVGGVYGRILAYDAAHSDADRLSVTAYLSSLYGDSALLRATKALTYGVTGPPLALGATKAQTYGVLGPPLLLSCTKSVMYVITGPDDGTRQRLKVRYVRSHR